MPRVAKVVVVVVASIVVAGVALADHHPSVLDSQPFAAGPLPGSPAVVIKTKGSDRHCGGVAITATVKAGKKGTDKALAAVFKLKFPTDLDFDPDHEAVRVRSMKKFDAWYDAVDKAARTATDHFKQIMADTSLAPAARAAAAARIVQVTAWTAYTFGRGPIPKNVAKLPEATSIYCDTLRDKADPLLYLATSTAEACRAFTATIQAGAGWWDDACAGP